MPNAAKEVPLGLYGQLLPFLFLLRFLFLFLFLFLLLLLFLLRFGFGYDGFVARLVVYFTLLDLLYFNFFCFIFLS